MACVLVMSNLAQVAAVYTYVLFGLDSAADSRLAQAGLGTAFILVMAVLAYRGIRVAATTQFVLLTVEVVALLWFAINAFREAGSLSIPAFSETGDSAWAAGVLVAVFLYWGWDSSFSVNEETRDPSRTPAIAALIANGFLVLAVRRGRVGRGRVRRGGSARGYRRRRLLRRPVARPARHGRRASSWSGRYWCRRWPRRRPTILPTARTMLSMARRDAFPGQFARISARYQTPTRVHLGVRRGQRAGVRRTRADLGRRTGRLRRGCVGAGVAVLPGDGGRRTGLLQRRGA